VKNHDFTPKNHIVSNFRGGGGTARRVRLHLDPPLWSSIKTKSYGKLISVKSVSTYGSSK
jgi:hypothetical protein